MSPRYAPRRRAQGGPDAALITALARALAVGAPLSVACTAHGVSESTVRYWLREGKKGRRPYADLARALEAARVSHHDELEAALGRRLKGETTHAHE